MGPWHLRCSAGATSSFPNLCVENAFGIRAEVVCPCRRMRWWLQRQRTCGQWALWHLRCSAGASCSPTPWTTMLSSGALLQCALVPLTMQSVSMHARAVLTLTPNLRTDMKQHCCCSGEHAGRDARASQVILSVHISAACSCEAASGQSLSLEAGPAGWRATSCPGSTKLTTSAASCRQQPAPLCR